jgi:hypothetical protein
MNIICGNLLAPPAQLNPILLLFNRGSSGRWYWVVLFNFSFRLEHLFKFFREQDRFSNKAQGLS